MKPKLAIHVRWVMRFADWGLADVLWIDRSGRQVDCVRIHGRCVDTAEARRLAKMARAGERLPSHVKAYAAAQKTGQNSD